MAFYQWPNGQQMYYYNAPQTYNVPTVAPPQQQVVAYAPQTYNVPTVAPPQQQVVAYAPQTYTVPTAMVAPPRQQVVGPPQQVVAYVTSPAASEPAPPTPPPPEQNKVCFLLETGVELPDGPFLAKVGEHSTAKTAAPTGCAAPSRVNCRHYDPYVQRYVWSCGNEK